MIASVRQPAVRPAFVLANGGSLAEQPARSTSMVLDQAWRSVDRRRSARVTQRLATASAVFVGVLFVVVVAFGGSPSGASGDQVGPSASNGASVTWVVRSGDTPWSIARAVQPQGDVRPLVSEIERSLNGEPLRVGQRITIG